MASSLPGSGSLSAGTKAGAERSVNLLKNDVVTPTPFNSRFSLKESSDTLASTKTNGFVLPRMVVGPPYKFSELYSAGKMVYKQIIKWEVVIDGGDYYALKPGIKGILLNNSTTVLLSAKHDRFQKSTTGVVKNIYNFFSNKPNRIYVRVYGSQGAPKINGVTIFSTGNNSNKTVDVAIDILPDSNGSFNYTIGDMGWGGGITTVTLLEQPDPTGTFVVTHKSWQNPGKPVITSTLYLNDAVVEVHTVTGKSTGVTELPFKIIQPTKASIKWSGRGTVQLTEAPTAENSYATTIWVYDHQDAQGRYNFELTLS